MAEAKGLGLLIIFVQACLSNEMTKQLFEDIMKRTTDNKLRPVGNASSKMTLNLGLRLSQLADVDEKNQIITTNVWLLHEWMETSLAWDPQMYGGLDKIYIPSEKIWLPDVVLYNNADGNYEVTLMTKATLYSNGRVRWEPPVIYKSFCAIDVEFYPFDIQHCSLKFGSWTYDGYQVDLKLLNLHGFIQQNNRPKDEESYKLEIIADAIDLREFYPSVEWDLLGVPAMRNEEHYPCCSEPYLDITFNITIRRKTLFHIVNLIIPCVAITFLTVLVFFLPSESGEKISLSVSILLSLTVFFLLLAEIIPPTSIVIPLIVKYLLFTMLLVTLSTLVTVIVLNVHYRTTSTHTMSPWVRQMFLKLLPRILGMRRPKCFSQVENAFSGHDNVELQKGRKIKGEQSKNFMKPWFGSLAPRDRNKSGGRSSLESNNVEPKTLRKKSKSLSPHKARSRDSYLSWKIPRPKIQEIPRTLNTGLRKSISSQIVICSKIPRPKWVPASASSTRKFPVDRTTTENLAQLKLSRKIREFRKGVEYLGGHMQKQDQDMMIKEDWKFVAKVLDRLFLWIFTSACVVGTFGIILQAPAIYDNSAPIGMEGTNTRE